MRKHRRSVAFVAALRAALRAAMVAAMVAGVAGVASPASAGPIVVGTGAPPSWTPVVNGAVDHARWDSLLARYVDERGLVRYAAWKEEALPALDEYLNGMAMVSAAPLARPEQLAYWINVYNALTVRAILHFYPLESIREKVSWLGFNIWKDYRIRIGAEERSLDDIEHGILRKMGEPRIHFAIVCASHGCPRLRDEAYRGARLEEQLEDDARAFFARADALAIDRPARNVRLSRILDWFGGDFGADDAARLAFVARFAPSAADSAFLLEPGLRVTHSEYDWSLNERD